MTFVPAHGAGYVTAAPHKDIKDVAITVPIPFGTLAVIVDCVGCYVAEYRQLAPPNNRASPDHPQHQARLPI
jgi:hypothetical protein